jgi:predicted PhzF superfamily epimerase YddE/YHI9
VASYHLLNVFTADDGSFGNPLGVFLERDAVPEAARQRVAAELGYSETVFVLDPASGELRIHTPASELPLAGHPLVGTAWLLAREAAPVEVLRPPAGEVGVRYEDELTWVAARPEWAPPFELVQLDSPAEVDALDGPPEGMGWVGLWAWADEGAGTIRKRVFAPEAGIPEDEATGAAAMLLAAHLEREVEIRQGRGSVIHARPLDGGWVEIGGRVVLERAGPWFPEDRPA